MLKNITREIREIKVSVSSSSQRLEDKLNRSDRKVDKLQTTVDNLTLTVDEFDN